MAGILIGCQLALVRVRSRRGSRCHVVSNPPARTDAALRRNLWTISASKKPS